MPTSTIQSASLVCCFLLLCGCGSTGTKFSYPPPSSRANSNGPTIQVATIVDARNSRAMDKDMEQGYLLDVQRAIANELQSMNFFSVVSVATDTVELATTDFRLTPTLKRLESQIPDYWSHSAKGAVVGLFTGAIGSRMYGQSTIDVLGHSVLDVRVEQRVPPRLVLETEYRASVTNRMEKDVCDTPETKASMMVQALRQSMALVKSDLQKKLVVSDRGASLNTATNSTLATPEK